MRDGPAPLILTLRCDDAAQDRLEQLRRAHFPAGRNVVPAHATLFHALPGDAEFEVRQALADHGGTARFPVTIAAVRSLGRGVALDLRAPELEHRRARIAACFAGRLTRQDGARFHPHVTIQNKVEPAQARALHRELLAGFAPWTAQAAAFELWRYLGGPWEPVETHPLA